MSNVIVPDGVRLILATHNEGKVNEFRQILTPLIPDFDPSSVVSAKGLGVEEPVEDGTSFAANALIKAQALCKATGLPAIADDSGLCVDILGGAPGIFSARWCGHHGDDEANLSLLLNQLADIVDPHRGAHFMCAAALALPEGEPVVCQAQMVGRLVTVPEGDNGFGYDPIFVPASEDAPGGQGRTTAQMSSDEKNAISHRGQALRMLSEYVAAVFVPQPE
ncbi:RdgB/HAM1 family non-canonical purine NTP pyrophosphatase [Actinomyces vulturis]|uniref:RdgB/HAM1 family non-canonical purine NTP pyrophosphatase n=1 Tax=Actinomyces vulturis TaxID=1857645 RepID=UPI00082A111D|nr:RdgB/HAM1 family non-canonical purine NTP pyrophosphatase [Actinomyces vulturis]